MAAAKSVSKTKKPVPKVTKPASSATKTSKTVTKEKVVPAIAAVKTKFTATQLYDEIAARTEVLSRAQVRDVLKALESIILGSVVKKGIGEFNLSGLFKVKTVKKPAVKGGKTAVNPFTKETYITKDKPASFKVKILPMKKLKDAAVQ